MDEKKKWRYECYICGVKKLGEGEMVKQCNCKHGTPVKLHEFHKKIQDELAKDDHNSGYWLT